MAMAALRREGRRFPPLISPNPINALRSSLAPSEEQACLGIRSISTQIGKNQHYFIVPPVHSETLGLKCSLYFS
ncbi:hypothetical protein U1Q18_036617 [Sarracenia purpurea var. burkii]